MSEPMASRTRLSEQSLGYLVHTNRELGLMLRGAKPLAIFSDLEGRFPELLLRYMRMFDRHVADGIFVRRDHYEPSGAHTLHVVLFAVRAEAWRMDAMINLRRRRKGWTAEDERAEGKLLGYEDWQNDIWIARQYRPR